MSKHTNMKSLTMWIMGALLTIALGAGAFIVNGIDADTKKLQVDLDTLKSLQATDYAELFLGQQAIRADIAAVAKDRRIMDSLILDKLEKLTDQSGP